LARHSIEVSPAFPSDLLSESTGKCCLYLSYIGWNISGEKVAEATYAEGDKAGLKFRPRVNSKPSDTSYDGDDDSGSSINNRILIRGVRKQKNFEELNSPSVRVTLSPYTPEEDSFKFDTIEFELYNNGPSVHLCRSGKQSNRSAILSKGKVKFGTRAISRKSHAHIWCENDKVSDSSLDEESVSTIDEGLHARCWFQYWHLVE
jgi:hypothetical protein